MIGDQVYVLGEYTWRTAGWPAGVGAVGVLAALGLVVASAVAPRSGGGRPWVAANLGVATIFGALCAAGAPALVPGTTNNDTAVTTTAQAFGGLLAVESLTGGATVALVGVAAAIWLARARAGDPPWVRAGLAVPTLSLALFTLGHVAWLRGVGPLPALEPLDLPPRVHVGRVIEVDASISGAGSAWELVPTRLIATAPGPLPVVFVARRFGVLGTRTMSVAAGEDRFDPAVTLAVGHEWVFEHTTRWHNQYLWVVSAPGEARGERTAVRVTGTREVPGLRVYDIDVVAPSGTSTLSAYAWDGAAYVYEEGGGEPRPFLALDAATVAADGTVPCTSAVFPGAGCACYPKAPGGPLSLPGPVRCAWTDGNAMSTGVSAFLAIVTLGLVLEDPDRAQSVELVASDAGRQAGWAPAGPSAKP